MRGLDIDAENLKNQQEVVKNEVKVNVLNQPYGGFPWIDLPMAANENWYNAHNFYGDLAHLDAATLDDVRAFFKTFYAPNNAVLVVSGDFDAGSDEGLDRKVLRGHSCREAAGAGRSHASRDKRRRSAPAVPTRWRIVRRSAIAYHLPERFTPEWYAFGLIDRAHCARCRLAALRRAGAQDVASREASMPASTGASATCSTTAARCCGLRSSSTTASTTSDYAARGDRQRRRSCAKRRARPGDTRSRTRQDAFEPLRRTWSSSPGSAEPTCSRRSRCSTTTRRKSIRSKRSSPR